MAVNDQDKQEKAATEAAARAEANKLASGPDSKAAQKSVERQQHEQAKADARIAELEAELAQARATATPGGVITIDANGVIQRPAKAD